MQLCAFNEAGDRNSWEFVFLVHLLQCCVHGYFHYFYFIFKFTFSPFQKCIGFLFCLPQGSNNKKNTSSPVVFIVISYKPVIVMIYVYVVLKWLKGEWIHWPYSFTTCHSFEKRLHSETGILWTHTHKTNVAFEYIHKPNVWRLTLLSSLSLDVGVTSWCCHLCCNTKHSSTLGRVFAPACGWITKSVASPHLRLDAC